MFVALGILHAKRMCRIIVSSVACSALRYFSTLSHQRHDFREKVIEHKMRVLSLSTIMSEKFFILREIDGHTMKNVYWSLCEVPLIFIIV